MIADSLIILIGIIIVTQWWRSFVIFGHSAEHLHPLIHLHHLLVHMLLLLHIIESMINLTLILILTLMVEKHLRVTFVWELVRRKCCRETCYVVMSLIENGSERRSWLRAIIDVYRSSSFLLMQLWLVVNQVCVAQVVPSSVLCKIIVHWGVSLMECCSFLLVSRRSCSRQVINAASVLLALEAHESASLSLADERLPLQIDLSQLINASILKAQPERIRAFDCRLLFQLGTLTAHIYKHCLLW